MVDWSLNCRRVCTGSTLPRETAVSVPGLHRLHSSVSNLLNSRCCAQSASVLALKPKQPAVKLANCLVVVAGGTKRRVAVVMAGLGLGNVLGALTGG